jgi:hypothetical protein
MSLVFCTVLRQRDSVVLAVPFRLICCSNGTSKEAETKAERVLVQNEITGDDIDY